MTISKDLFLAILAMDSYNRGYDPGISDGKNVENNVDTGLGDAVGTRVGSATVSHRVSSDPNGVAQSTGFYAIAYEVDGSQIAGWGEETKVIAYRGRKTAPSRKVAA